MQRGNEDLITKFNNRVLDSDCLSSSSILTQSKLSDIVDNKISADLSEMSSSADKARLSALSSPHAADWLMVTPSPGLANRLLPEEMQVLIKHRLGLALSSEGDMCPLCTGKVLDPAGHHALTCKRGPDVTSRHTSIKASTVQSRAQRRLVTHFGGGRSPGYSKHPNKTCRYFTASLVNGSTRGNRRHSRTSA